jgi:prepilin peptidase CpaA
MIRQTDPREELKARMNLHDFHFRIFLLTACIVLPAAICDLKWRRIPNHLTFTMILIAFSLHSMHAGWTGLLFSLKGMALGGGVFLVLHLFGAMGAGDVKLMGGVGALLGSRLVTTVLLLTVFVGGLLALGKLGMHLAKRYGVNEAWSEKPPPGAPERDDVSGFGCRAANPMKATIPYGVAIAAGTLITIILFIAAGRIS